MRYTTLTIPIVAVVLATACNHRPNQVIDAAEIAGLELAAIKAEANRQQQALNARAADLAQSVSRHQDLTRDFEQQAKSLPLLWRIRDEKPRLRFLGELKAEDPQLLSDPYLLARRPPAPTSNAVLIDTTGLDSAIEGIGRITDEKPLSKKQGAKLLFDALKNVDMPAKP